VTHLAAGLCLLCFSLESYGRVERLAQFIKKTYNRKQFHSVLSYCPSNEFEELLIRGHEEGAVEILTDLQIDIKEPEVLRRVGYKEKKVVPQGKIGEILKEAVSLGYQLAKPLVLYARFTIKGMDEKGLVLEGGSRLNIGSRVKLWEGAEYMTAALCTIGAGLEQSTSELFSKGEFMLAYMLDGVGSVAIDSLVVQVQQLICQMAHQSGMIAGPRLSPGSKGWPLEEQRVLFSLLPAEKISLRLTERCMMIPQKSISSCIGSGHEQVWKGLESEKVLNPCQLCNMANCLYRRLEP